MHLNGVVVTHKQLNPQTFTIPREGLLQLDYVTYDLPKARFQASLFFADLKQLHQTPPATPAAAAAAAITGARDLREH